MQASIFILMAKVKILVLLRASRWCKACNVNIVPDLLDRWCSGKASLVIRFVLSFVFPITHVADKMNNIKQAMVNWE